LKFLFGASKNQCHAVSSVVLGGKEEFFREVYMTDFQWADQLINREADVLFAGVTHTLQREIREENLVKNNNILLASNRRGVLIQYTLFL